MCPCASAASFFADALYRCPAPLRQTVESAASVYPRHFDSEMLQLSWEDFEAGDGGHYRCSQCKQWWFLVFADEECPPPIFGVKSSEEERRNVVLRGGVDLAVRNLAVELGPHNVRINAIAPGVMRTDFARALWEDPKAEAALQKATPLGRIGEPEEIAGAALFLAAKAATYMTGQTIVVDGGATARGVL